VAWAVSSPRQASILRWFLDSKCMSTVPKPASFLWHSVQIIHPSSRPGQKVSLLMLMPWTRIQSLP